MLFIIENNFKSIMETKSYCRNCLENITISDVMIKCISCTYKCCNNTTCLLKETEKRNKYNFLFEKGEITNNSCYDCITEYQVNKFKTFARDRYLKSLKQKL